MQISQALQDLRILFTHTHRGASASSKSHSRPVAVMTRSTKGRARHSKVCSARPIAQCIYFQPKRVQQYILRARALLPVREFIPLDDRTRRCEREGRAIFQLYARADRSARVSLAIVVRASGKLFFFPEKWERINESVYERGSRSGQNMLKFSPAFNFQRFEVRFFCGSCDYFSWILGEGEILLSGKLTRIYYFCISNNLIASCGIIFLLPCVELVVSGR